MKNKQNNWSFLVKLFLIKILVIFVGLAITKAYSFIPVVLYGLVCILLFEFMIITYFLVDIVKCLGSIVFTLMAYWYLPDLFDLFPLWFNLIILLLISLVMVFLVLKTNFVDHVCNKLNQKTVISLLLSFGLLFICVKLCLLLILDMYGLCLDYSWVSAACVTGLGFHQMGMFNRGTIRELSRGVAPGVSNNCLGHSKDFILGTCRKSFGTDIYEMKDKKIKKYVDPISIFRHYWVTNEDKKIATTLTTQGKNAHWVSDELVNDRKNLNKDPKLEQHMYKDPFRIDAEFLSEHLQKLNGDGGDYAAKYQKQLTKVYNQIVSENECKKSAAEEYQKVLETKKKNVKL